MKKKIYGMFFCAIMILVLTGCAKTETNIISTPTEIPHEHEWKLVTTEATCTTDGYSVEMCECGVEQNEIVISATGHVECTYQIVTNPSMEEEGAYDNICNICGTVVNSGSIPKLTPTPTPEPTVTPTPEPTVMNTPTPTEVPHEHVYTESVSQEATCTEAGEKTFTCECGDTYTENIEATGHTYGKYTYNNDATYEKDGTETANCICGLTDTRIVTGSKLEYTYEVGVWNDMEWYCFKVCATEEEARNLGHGYEYCQLIEGRYPGELVICNSGPTKWGYWVYVWQTASKGTMVIPWSVQ